MTWCGWLRCRERVLTATNYLCTLIDYELPMVEASDKLGEQVPRLHASSELEGEPVEVLPRDSGKYIAIFPNGSL